MLAQPFRKAFTLVELLLTMAVAALVLTMFVWFLVSASHISSQNTARVDMQQTAVITALRMERDLKSSTRSGITLYPQSKAGPGNPVVMALVPIDDVNVGGRRLWRQQVIAYHWQPGTRELYRRDWPPQVSPAAFSVDPLPTDRPLKFSDAEMIALSGQPGQPAAQNVVDFDVDWAGRAVNVRMSLEQDVSGRQAPLRFDYEKVVALRH